MTRHVLFVALLAGGALGAQSLPPVHPVGPVTAATKEALGGVTGVRELAGGKLLVNDAVQRRLLVFDSTLQHVTVIADSTTGSSNGYGSRPAGLLPYLADSSLFVDQASTSFLVIDPQGKVVRVMSPPRTRDMTYLASSTYGTPGFDAQGRLVYRGVFGSGAIIISASGGYIPPTPPDTAPVVRVDMNTRLPDTIGVIKIPLASEVKYTATPTGGFTGQSFQNPLPRSDDFAVTSDGSVALLRSFDFHIDWINADGSKTSTGKIPFDWKALGPEEKNAIIDTARARGNRARALLPAPTGPTGAPMPIPPFLTVTADRLPDYAPPFAAGGVKPDRDNNLWIKAAPNPLHFGAAQPTVYYVVDRSGQLTDRVEMPANKSLVGFGRNGVLYLMVSDDKGIRVERVTRK